MRANSCARLAACAALNACYDRPQPDPEPTPPAGALRPDFAEVYAEDVYGRLAASATPGGGRAEGPRATISAPPPEGARARGVRLQSVRHRRGLSCLDTGAYT